MKHTLPRDGSFGIRRAILKTPLASKKRREAEPVLVDGLCLVSCRFGFTSQKEPRQERLDAPGTAIERSADAIEGRDREQRLVDDGILVVDDRSGNR